MLADFFIPTFTGFHHAAPMHLGNDLEVRNIQKKNMRKSKS
jgi:hypothetical protein